MSTTTQHGLCEPRVDKFLKELIWMARVLRYRRGNIPEPKTD